uniref:WxL domain-containing protein n=1 Tax=Loigolactobacillus rennini TaxID=238013 RepID=A0A1K2I8T1_9LACO|nr:hypothetical protein LREN565_1896 [Loigolactobacillus rennini]
MKFTKLTSTLLFGTMVAAALAAPVTAYAATEEGNVDANDGDALPQSDNTKAGISFGQSGSNGNTGYLRLAQVPSAFDFGNHTTFEKDANIFYANGQDEAGKFAHENYKTTKDSDAEKDNATTTLDTDNEDLSDVNGKSPVIVVDKQVLRDGDEVSGNNTNESGEWTLTVKSDSPLKRVSQNGKEITGGSEITGGTLTLANTAYARTTNVASLTGDDNDNDFTIPEGAQDTDVGTILGQDKNGIAISLDDSSEHEVAKAEKDEGLGANVFAWDKNDISLELPKSSAVNSGIYQSNLTWTLKTGITAGSTPGGDTGDQGGDTENPGA